MTLPASNSTVAAVMAILNCVPITWLPLHVRVDGLLPAPCSNAVAKYEGAVLFVDLDRNGWGCFPRSHPGVVRRRSVDRRDLCSHRTKIAGELPPVVNGVEQKS